MIDKSVTVPTTVAPYVDALDIVVSSSAYGTYVFIERIEDALIFITLEFPTVDASNLRM